MRINRWSFAALVVGGLWSANGTAQVQTAPAPPDTAPYAAIPPEYLPYGRFENPYKEFFRTKLEYPGYGRHIPEPEHVDVVKIGFIGPIIGSISESVGGPEEIVQRVSELQAHWDGYRASYLAPIGIKMLQGAQLAVAQANARGGYRGQTPYELVVRNDNGAWRNGGEEVIKLAWQDSVWAVLGAVDGEVTHILIRAALKAELPVMNTADTDPTLVETNIPWVFRNITDDRQMCYLLADFAFKQLGLKRVAALRVNDRYGRVNIDEFRDAATRLGSPLVAEMSYREGDTLFTSQLELLKSLDVDGVFTYGNARGSALILKQMRETGMNQWFFGSDRMVTQEFLDIVGPEHGSVAAGFPWDPERENPRYLRFVDDFSSKYGEPPETYAAHTYDGTMMLIDAIERAGLNRALIRDELVAIEEYDGVTGTQVFDAVLSTRSPATLAVLKDGRFEYYTREEVMAWKR